MPTIGISGFPDGIPATPHHGLSRRSLLRWSGAAGISLLASACGGGGAGGVATPTSAGTVTVPTPTPTPTPAPAPAPTPTPTAAGKTQFGVNYYDLFHRFITAAAPFDPEKQLQPLKDRGLKIVRFAACPLWARDWTLWNGNPEKYLAGLDRIFDAADRLGMQLVPVLMSAPFGLSDLHGEPFSAWGNPNSATRRAFDAFVPTIVKRYKSRSALFMWEMSNEMNAFANNPNGYQYYPPVDTQIGTPRTTADNYTSADIQNVYARFVELVRQHDTQHPVESGSTTPNNRETRRANGRTGLDSRDEFKQAMEQTLAGKSEVLSIHLYDDIAKDRFDAAGSNFAEILSLARAVADKNSAKLYVGEFGLSRSGDELADKVRFRRMLTELKDANVDYATVWCYDWLYSADWSITTDNDRAWMLDELSAANA